jgi:hypothetical protein
MNRLAKLEAKSVHLLREAYYSRGPGALFPVPLLMPCFCM